MDIYYIQICCFVYISSFLTCIQASVNLALGKPADQSSTSNGHNASLGVDGNPNADFRAGSCTHTLDGQVEAWWQVDLQTTAEVTSVIIYNAKDIFGNPLNRRLNGFQLYISSEPLNWRNSSPCYSDTASGNPPMNTTAECKGLGQYATVYTITPGSNEARLGPLLLLCEVQVFGCKNGTYGNTCSMNCSTNCIDTRCDPDDGICLLGCSVGWTGQKCDIQCTNNTFGQNCNSTCNCAQGGCHHVTGVCDVPGCHSGWRGDSCTETCLPNTFGPNCDTVCRCLNGSCDRMTGSCEIPGCQPGWIGNTCSEECTNNTFGHNCNLTCNCAQGGCHHVNGVCAVPGCQPGWRGSTCSEACFPNTFGQECATICRCMNGSCNHVSGICEVPGCQPGWMGNTCSEACRRRSFGTNCSSTCNCAREGCNPVNGLCLTPGCMKGWKGKSCSMSCDNSTFGKNCASMCYCLNGTCDHISGTCDIPGCIDGWIGRSCSQRIQIVTGPGQESPPVAGIVVGVLVAFLLAAAVIAAVLIYKHRQQKPATNKQTKRDGQNAMFKDNGDEANEGRLYMNVNNSAKASSSKKENGSVKLQIVGEDIYENTPKEVKEKPTIILVSDLEELISREHSIEDLEKQFQNIPVGPLYPHDVGKKAKNKSKNRFLTTFPYDYSRVVLEKLPDDPDSDYINANYIDSVEDKSTYIATQGPKTNTTVDFWRMVWQINSGKIVMLTGLVENDKVKCNRYWPESSSKRLSFGDFQIAICSEKVNLHFDINQLKVTNTKTGEVRIIHHFHFTAWPDHGVPDPVQLMLFHRKYMGITSEHTGPSVVHCSAGIGRTGTFIALDALYRYGKSNGEIDVCKYVRKMRDKRMNMIQTKDQYIVLHQSLLEDFEYEDTTVKKDNLTKKSEDTDQLEWEFKKLQHECPDYDRQMYKSATKKENIPKNRNQDILPVDRFRPYLMSFEKSRSDYINAVIVPSFRDNSGFIVTQYPLPDTVVDLWCLVYDNDSSIIVTLDDCPSQKENDDKTRTIKLFQYQNWKLGQMTPSSVTGFLRLVEMVECCKKSESKEPVTVLCSDGATCCGLLCLSFNILQNLKNDDCVDIYQQVRQLQKRRPEFLPVIEQYKFCHEVAREYAETANIYMNS